MDDSKKNYIIIIERGTENLSHIMRTDKLKLNETIKMIKKIENGLIMTKNEN